MRERVTEILPKDKKCSAISLSNSYCELTKTMRLFLQLIMQPAHNQVGLGCYTHCRCYFGLYDSL